VHLAPDDSSISEYQYLQTVAKDWQDKMAKAKLTHNDAQFYAWNHFMQTD